LIGAQWKPSNVGLDDIVLGQCAWGAKTVKAPRPGAAQRVRLISGRNGLNYSYNVTNAREHDPKEVGRLVLTIWNDRVAAMWGKYKHLRTTVLIKSDDLLELAVFEFETVRYIPEDYKWAWNSNSNLEGHNKAGEHCFTWQPNGSQFTIVEPVPANRLLIRLKQPPLLDREAYLKAVGFDSSWVKTE
jgi:hypothetical protein